jgi:hypothetical protein
VSCRWPLERRSPRDVRLTVGDTSHPSRPSPQNPRLLHKAPKGANCPSASQDRFNVGPFGGKAERRRVRLRTKGNALRTVSPDCLASAFLSRVAGVSPPHVGHTAHCAARGPLCRLVPSASSHWMWCDVLERHQQTDLPNMSRDPSDVLFGWPSRVHRESQLWLVPV